VADLFELYQWMKEQNPESPTFDSRISVGTYPAALAAFVTACSWSAWMVHAVYALHGDLYLARVRQAKSNMDQKSYRDNTAGASMHRANGLTHMVRCAKTDGLRELKIPCWDAPRSLIDIALLAVADMRTACTLRSEKYGQPGCSESIVKAYQASLRNLADAIEVHAFVAEQADGKMPKMLSQLRERATNLTLTDQNMLAVCADGSKLTASDERSVEQDVRVFHSVISAIAPPIPPQEQEVAPQAGCVQCRTADATHHGFSCRCLCLCTECVAATGARVLECPKCGEFTEFVRA